jgi:hypothetical protein
MSYYDKNLTDFAAFYEASPLAKYKYNYFYDTFGWVYNWTCNGTATGWGANVFTAGTNDPLRAIGITWNHAGDITYYVYKNPTAGNPRSGTLMASETWSSGMPFYYTIPLAPIALTAGDTFSVVTKVVNTSGTYPLAVDGVAAGYSSNSNNAAGQSYYSADGTTWTDFTTYNSNSYKFNCCIKAFTGGGIAKGDFNSDYQGDIVWRHYGTGQNAVWFLGNTGAAAPVAGLQQGFRPKEQELSPEAAGAIQTMMNPGNPANAKDWDALADLRKAADFRNGSRDKEIEFIDMDERTGGRTPIGMGAGPAFAPPVGAYLGYAYLLPVTEAYWYIVGTGDFNGDGYADILWQHDTTGTNIVWFMYHTTFSSYQYVLNAGDLNWKIAGTGDFNNDGKVDILWRHATSGANAVWYMNGYSYSSYAYLPGEADVNWKVVGTGDFNGDGKVDILWQHATTGANAVWYMNGATYLGYAYLPNAGDLNWKIVGTGDFNWDGRVDILWRHATTGANIVWYMNGATYVSYGYLTTEADVNWHIVNH